MFTKALLATGLLASLATAGPIRKRGATGQAVYWGTGDNSGNEQSLGHYCSSSQGISIIVLSFLDKYGNGVTPSGQIDQCVIDSSGNGSGCEQLTTDIQTCQDAGIKVFVSLGGGGATGTITGDDDANGVAWSLWNMFANPAVTDSSAPRPFGSVALDGWDIDVESSPDGNVHYKTMLNSLRGYFSSDSSKSYYISGAPQCPLPEANMGDMISGAQFDYLWVQFYNNQGYGCDVGQSGFNYDAWVDNIQGGASSGAQLFIGMLAASDAGNYESDYQSPSALAGILNEYQSHAQFGGAMIWDAAYSDETGQNGCTYSQEIAHILSSGNPC